MRKITLAVVFIILSCSSENVDPMQMENVPGEMATDVDGNTYETTITNQDKLSIGISSSTVKIGVQTWTTQNLNVTHYRNGDAIPQVQDNAVWNSLTTGAWCYYNNTAGDRKYGKLYNWYAVHDARGLAPNGWHIPSNEEWESLTTYLGGEFVAGGKMKTTMYWDAPNTGASNSSRFNAIPGGIRSPYGDIGFDSFGTCAYWWSASEIANEGTDAWSRSVNHEYAWIDRPVLDKRCGLSVRFVKN